ncbi:MAG: UDP-2,3-diacylglucosamine diphosphatase [Pseudomonadota bacterium]
MPGTTLFISDLHLEPGQAEVSGQFLAFMAEEARDADALYILGDLFEMWIGDDDPTPFYAEIKSAIRGLVDSGVPVYLMHGNRDFLLGEQFCQDTGATLLEEPTVIDLYGYRILLMHGDLLCSDDVDYQKFRVMVRNPAWQRMMRMMPFKFREVAAKKLRQQTRAATARKPSEIMDVNHQTVLTTMREYDVDLLLHGHTHRPAIHEFPLEDGVIGTRVVLGDWFDQGSVVRWDPEGLALVEMRR